MEYYPAFLNLKEKKVVVIGGGKVAERKVLSLLETGAEVTVISPECTERLRREKEKNRLRLISRKYRKGDIKDSFLVIAATDSADTNKRIAKDAPCLVNVVDMPSECNFIVPSTVRRGELKIAISTSGTSPAFSKTVRKDLEKQYGVEIAKYLRFVKIIREKAMSEIDEGGVRRRFLKYIASEEILNQLRINGINTVKTDILKKLNKLRSRRD